MMIKLPETLMPSAQDQLFSTVAAVLEPDSGTGADRKPTTKKIEQTLGRAKEFHREAFAWQLEFKRALLSPTTKTSELPALRLQHDGLTIAIERIGPQVVALDERLLLRRELEANEARAAAQGNARRKYDVAHAAVLAEIARLPALADAITGLIETHRAARSLGLDLPAPDAEFCFGQVVFGPYQHGEKFAGEIRELATNNTSLARTAREKERQQRAQEHARYEAEKRAAWEREKAERAAALKAQAEADQERRLRRAGAI